MVLISTTILLLASGASDAIAMGANPTQFVVQTRCPALKTYTPDQAKQLGAERKRVRSENPKSLLLETNDDYLILRDQCRSIESKK
jgi:hypothetical protein